MKDTIDLICDRLFGGRIWSRLIGFFSQIKTIIITSECISGSLILVSFPTLPNEISQYLLGSTVSETVEGVSGRFYQDRFRSIGCRDLYCS